MTSLPKYHLTLIMFVAIVYTLLKQCVYENP